MAGLSGGRKPLLNSDIVKPKSICRCG
ncbi:hypothetical protein [Paenibacillus sp. 1011MAR3C5]